MSDPSPMPSPSPMPMPMPIQSPPGTLPSLSPSAPSSSSSSSGGLWDSVDGLHAWLDAHGAVDGREALLLRVLKLSEEVGEVAQAVIGTTGQNPRKGTTHSWDDVGA